MRMVARGFLPSALAFTVFEHGADMMMRCVDVDAHYLAIAVSNVGRAFSDEPIKVSLQPCY